MIQTSSLPLRFPELGRIRLGEKGPKGQPIKGKFLRFSSNDQPLLEVLADRLGGAVVAWPNGEQSHHLTTESESVDVFLPPDPVDTAYERWGSGGCQKRCDGVRCSFLDKDPKGDIFLNSGDCRCLLEGLTPGDREDAKQSGACIVTVRLKVLIPDVPGIGVWICTSHSIYAAMELPGQAAIIAASLPRVEGGQPPLVPAVFAIEPRTEKKPWEKYKRDYIVPVLRIRRSLGQLMAPSQGNGHEVDRGERAAIAAPRPAIGAGAPAATAAPAAPAAQPDPFAEPGDTAPAATFGTGPNDLVTAGDREGFAGILGRKAQSLRLTWSQLASIIEEATGRQGTLDDVTTLEANKVIAAFGELKSGGS